MYPLGVKPCVRAYPTAEINAFGQQSGLSYRRNHGARRARYCTEGDERLGVTLPFARRSIPHVSASTALVPTEASVDEVGEDSLSSVRKDSVL